MRMLAKRSLGDLLSDAAANLVAAGYQNPTCRVERVFFPGVDPNTGLNYYEQEICSVPGYLGAFDANLVAAAGKIPGVGVDLAAERAYLNAQGDGPGTGQSYIEAFGGGSNVQVMNQLNPDGTRTRVNSAAPDPRTYTAQAPPVSATQPGQPEQPEKQVKNAGPFKTAEKTNPTGSPEVDEALFSDLRGINPMYLLAGAAVAALLIFRK